MTRPYSVPRPSRENRSEAGRRRFLHLSALGSIGALFGGIAAAGASTGTWKAGVARALITPEEAVWLAGYGSKRVPDGKLHELWAKALALEDASGHQAVMITTDFQGIPREMTDRIHARLLHDLGLERHQVMLTFSHNHCGPRLGEDLGDYYPIEAEQVALVEKYTTQMEGRLVSLVAESLKNLGPATLKLGAGQTGFAVNRRNNKEAEVAATLASGNPLQGPVDHSVPVMKVTRPDGRLEAVLFGYACHPTTLSSNTWCGDYPGFAQLLLEQRHPGMTAMFVNTCGGDQNPLPRRSVLLCERYGRMLAEAVEEALTLPLQIIIPRLRTAFAHVDLNYEKVMTRAEIENDLQHANPIRARWAARMLRRLDAGETFATSYPYPLHAWSLGTELTLLGLGAEAVVDYALRFKKELGPGTWVCGYVDDMVAYIPSRRVWEEGGYEGGSFLYEYRHPALRWAGDVEDRIAKGIHALVQKNRG